MLVRRGFLWVELTVMDKGELCLILCCPTWKHTYSFLYVYVCTHVCIFKCMHACVLVCVQACMCGGQRTLSATFPQGLSLCLLFWGSVSLYSHGWPGSSSVYLACLDKYQGFTESSSYVLCLRMFGTIPHCSFSHRCCNLHFVLLFPPSKPFHILLSILLQIYPPFSLRIIFTCIYVYALSCTYIFLNITGVICR